jgi:ABC-type transport system involved in multi-copper enzyme maturation permease subunit
MDLSALARSPGAIALLVAAALFLAALLSRRLWLRLLGPVFACEAVRQSRRGRTIALRGVYAAVLLAVLFVVVPPSLAPNRLALDKLAHEFSRAFLVAQAAAVLILTPLYVAGAVSDEKETRSLDFLVSAPLGDREIVLGKLAARLLNVFGLLFAGLPVLALTQLWGGVDEARTLAGFAAAALAALSVGSFAILCSVLARKTVRAVLTVYVVLFLMNLFALCLPYGYLLSPVALEFASEQSERTASVFQGGSLPLGQQALAFAVVHGVLALVCLSLAILQLRPSAGPPEPIRDPLLDLIPPTFDADGARIWPALPTRDRAPPVMLALPPVNEYYPLLWKEAFVGRSADATLMADMAWMCFGVLVVVTALLALTGQEQLADLPRSVFLAFLAPPAAALITGVAYRLAGSITHEREARTLEGLLALPCDRTAVLAAKWLGAFRRAGRVLIMLALTLVMGTIGKAIHPLSAALLLAAILVHAAFGATLGLFLSTTCRSTVRARLFLFATSLAILAGTWLGHQYAGGPVEPNWPTLIYDGFNPIRTFEMLTFGRIDIYEARWSVSGIALLFGLAAYAVGTAVLWLGTVCRFRREMG